MKTSVVIVTFNGMKWIGNCLKSIIDNTISTEIIIVDNCSSDNTVSYLKNNFIKKIRLIELQQNLGFGQANNLGISSAIELKSDFIFLLNQDTVIDHYTIEKLITVSKNNLEYGIISPIHADGSGKCLDKSFLFYLKNSYSHLISDAILSLKMKEIYPVEMINAAAWFVPIKTFETVGGFDPIFFLYGEDDNFCQRVIFHNLKIGITPTTIIRHDSGNNYKVDFPIGSENYFNKFLNRIKVKYANVNTEDYKSINKIRRYFVIKAMLSLIKFKFDLYRVNIFKYKLINKKNIQNSVFQNRKSAKHYLS